MVKEIKDLAQFQALVAVDCVTLVDFYATWCPPCKAIAPYVVQLAKENPHVQFIKVNVDHAREIAEEYEINAMPTFIFFRTGTQRVRFAGANKKRLDDTLAALAPPPQQHAAEADAA